MEIVNRNKESVIIRIERLRLIIDYTFRGLLITLETVTTAWHGYDSSYSTVPGTSHAIKEHRGRGKKETPKAHVSALKMAVVRFTLRYLHPIVKAHRTHWVGICVGTRVGLPGIEPRPYNNYIENDFK
jgi:hypothetical protein